MSVFIQNDTRILVQGITGEEGKFHTERMLDYGTNIVAGVTPGKGGRKINNVPVYDTVREAVNETSAEASIIFVPPAFAADAILESLNSELKLTVAITEGIPVHDMLLVKRCLFETGTQLVGPNCPGIISPGKSKLGIMPGSIFKEGDVGILSRSGTLTYQIADSLVQRGIGQSTVIGIGGDPIIGTSFIDALQAFENDEETNAIVLVGEIGGSDEEKAAEWIKENGTKPVVALIAGRTAPSGKRMGHAGAIVTRATGTAKSKIKAFQEAGIEVGETPKQVGEKIKKVK